MGSVERHQFDSASLMGFAAVVFAAAEQLLEKLSFLAVGFARILQETARRLSPGIGSVAAAAAAAAAAAVAAAAVAAVVALQSYYQKKKVRRLKVHSHQIYLQFVVVVAVAAAADLSVQIHSMIRKAFQMWRQ